MAEKTPAKRQDATSKQARPITDQQRLWLFLYARRAFFHVEAVCKQVGELRLKTTSPLYYPLFVAMVTLYARPFMNNFGVGALSADIVPEDEREGHDGILLMRSKLVAHTDANGPQAGDFLANEVRFVREKDDFAFCSTEPKGLPDMFERVLPLAQKLQAKCLYHAEKLRDRHAKEIPAVFGEYVLDLEDNPETFYVKAPTRIGNRLSTIKPF